MRLKSFRVKNYKSTQDTGEVLLSRGGISVFAGQNESGKSAVLEALDAFEQSSFDQDSVPFDFEAADQVVSCTYLLGESDIDFWDKVEDQIAEDFKIKHAVPGDVLDLSRIKKNVKEFTIVRSTEVVNRKKVKTSIGENIFQLIKSSILEVATTSELTKPDGGTEVKKEKNKLFELTDEDISGIADAVWRNTPKIVLFNDFCDLLPDKFSLQDLKTGNKEAKGYKAVKNFETVSGANFLELYKLDDLKRDSSEEKHNETVSIDFSRAWKQQIHGDNKVKLSYKFEKRDTEESSYIVFYVETKDRQKIRPRMRSKGLVWFLSFWLELRASGDSNDLIILADEPGLYLHIKAQTDILALFDDLVKKGHQILYSTHSPNLIKTDHLERISLVINDGAKGTCIEGITTSKINSQNKQDALQPVANAIGFSVSDFSLSNKKNALVEGVSDYFYYLGMRRLLKRKDIYALIPGIGVRKQSTLVSFCLGYGLDWVCVFDDDSSRGSDSQKTYLQIKEQLFSGDDDVAAAKMYITKGISSVENMFSVDDMKLIDPMLAVKNDAALSVGDKRKVIFAKSFYEKVDSGQITRKQLDAGTVTRFNKVFDWIEIGLGL